MRIKWLYLRLRKFCNKKNNCLDFGGGGGVFLPTLSSFFSNVVCIDLEVNESKKISKFFNLKNVSFIEGDIVKETLPEFEFDVIIAADVLEHFKDLEPAITNIKKWLKIDGTLFTSLPTENWLYTVLRKVFRVQKPLDHYHTGYEVETILKKSGFRPIHKSCVPLYFGFFPLYLITVWKKI
tara:strand:+ start:1164 stop:1706 length:543 start_codon:yes stop_codon:yes gene_type:complete